MTVGAGGQTGVKSYMALFLESSLGSMDFASTTGNAYTLEPLSIGFKTEIVSMKLDAISANRGYTKRVQTDKSVGGTLEHYLHPTESPLLLSAALGGAISSSAGSTGVYIHSISAGNFPETNGSVAFLVRKGDEWHHCYYGGRVNSMKITAVIGEPVKCSYDFVFINSEQTGSAVSIETSLSVSTLMPFVYTDGVFRYHNTEASIGTTTVEEHITGFELTVNNNIVTDANARALGTNTLIVLPPGRRDIEFKVTQRFDTTLAYDRFIANTMGVIELNFEGASLSATKFLQCQIRLPKVYHNSPDFEVASAGDMLMQEIDFAVLVDAPMTTTGRDIGITILNGVDSYTSKVV